MTDYEPIVDEDTEPQRRISTGSNDMDKEFDGAKEEPNDEQYSLLSAGLDANQSNIPNFAQISNQDRPGNNMYKSSTPDLPYRNANPNPNLSLPNIMVPVTTTKQTQQGIDQREQLFVQQQQQQHNDKFNFQLNNSNQSMSSIGSFNRPTLPRSFTPLTPRGLAIYASQKFKKGSMKGAIVTIIISIVGAGMLSLPFGIREFGLIPAILLLAFAGYLAYFSLDLLLIVCNYLPENSHPSYRLLSLLSGGKKLAYISQGTILVQFCGSATAYLVTAGGLCDLVWNVLGGKSPKHIYLPVVIIIAIIIIWPLSLMKDMSSLRHTSLLGFLCTSYLGLILFIEYFLLCDNPSVRESNTHTKHDWNYSTCFWDGNFRLKTSMIFPINEKSIIEGFLTAFPLFVFAYTCHQNMLPIYVELNRRSRRRMQKVLKRSLLIAFTIYVMGSVCGFLTFLEGTCSNVLLNNFHQSPQIIAAAIALAISVTLTQPIFTYTFRMNLAMLIYNKKDIESNIIFHIATALFVICVTVVSLTVTNIATVFGLLGSTTYPLIGYVYPAIFFYKLVPPERYPVKRVLAVVQAVFVFSASIASLAYKIYHGVNSTPNCDNIQTIVE